MWRSFCEFLNECGRNGALFVKVLLLVLLLLAGVAPFWDKGGKAILLGIALWILFRFVVWIRNQSGPRGGWGKLPPLSRNELQSARSKLKSDGSRE